MERGWSWVAEGWEGGEGGGLDMMGFRLCPFLLWINGKHCSCFCFCSFDLVVGVTGWFWICISKLHQD